MRGVYTFPPVRACPPPLLNRYCGRTEGCVWRARDLAGGITSYVLSGLLFIDLFILLLRCCCSTETSNGYQRKAGSHSNLSRNPKVAEDRCQALNKKEILSYSKTYGYVQVTPKKVRHPSPFFAFAHSPCTVELAADVYSMPLMNTEHISMLTEEDACYTPASRFSSPHGNNMIITSGRTVLRTAVEQSFSSASYSLARAPSSRRSDGTDLFRMHTISVGDADA